MVDLYPTISIITLSVCGLTPQLKGRDCCTALKDKNCSTTRCLQENHCKWRDINKLKVKGWIKIYHAHCNQKKAEAPMLTSDKVGFRATNIIRDKKDYFIMIKVSR